MALLDIYAARYMEDDFYKQVGGACFKAAMDIIVEDPGTSNHANRLIWAEEAKLTPKGKAIEMLADVIDNDTISAALPIVTDNDVQFVVNSLVDTYATG